MLEAIYYLCMGKGYFTSGEQYNFKKGESSFLIEGKFILEKYEDSIKVIYKNLEGKALYRNEIKYLRIAEHVGKYPVMVIEPDDTLIIAEGGETRRKLIDQVICQVDHNYLEHLIIYNKILLQRNSLLKSMYEKKNRNDALLEVYDKQLCEIAIQVFNKRKEISAEVQEIMNTMYHTISGGKEIVSMEYDSDLHKNDLQSLLIKNREKDLYLQRTTSGIHKDDYDLRIENQPVKKFGSQGQKKSMMIAWKLALYQWIKNKKEVLPILLLDDIFDKLDEERVSNLFTLISTPLFGQVFITDTEEDRLRKRFISCTKEVNFIALPYNNNEARE